MKKIKLNLGKLNSSRLQLQKETITNLMSTEMRQVYGGYQTSQITCSLTGNTCDCTGPSANCHTYGCGSPFASDWCASVQQTCECDTWLNTCNNCALTNTCNC